MLPMLAPKGKRGAKDGDQPKDTGQPEAWGTTLIAGSITIHTCHHGGEDQPRFGDQPESWQGRCFSGHNVGAASIQMWMYTYGVGQPQREGSG